MTNRPCSLLSTAAERLRELDADGVPRGIAAGLIEGADCEAAALVAAIRLRVLVAAAPRIWVATGESTVADGALGHGDARADLIPHRLAAGRVDRTDRVAAILVIAVRIVVREAALSSLGRAAERIGACDLACRVDAGSGGTEVVPLRGAAEDVDQADCIAACLIIAPRRELWLAAFTGAGIAAAELVVLAAHGVVDAACAVRIPLGRAAERIESADRGAACTVAAGCLVVGDVAAAESRITAFRQVGSTDLAGAGRAVGIPFNLAAILELLARADILAAFADRAARGEMRGEAVAGDDLSASSEAGLSRGEDAR